MKVHDGFYRRRDAEEDFLYTREGRGWFLSSGWDYKRLFVETLWGMTSQNYLNLGELMLPEEYLK